MIDRDRIVITGIGLTAPIGNSLAEMRKRLLACEPNISDIELRYIGAVHAGVCNFDARKHQNRKAIRNGTRAGSIAVYCAHESVEDSGIDWDAINKRRVGVYLGITEHGGVETENEVYNISKFDYDTRFWTHHHNPRTVSNNAAGEVTINMGITGPHYTIGAACAAGNAGVIQGAQMLRLNEVDVALAGGVSESVGTFGIFAAFKSQGALAQHTDANRACRPFDKERNGIVVSEGGCVYTLERLPDALARGARIYGEVAGYCINSDATDAVLPNAERQAECMASALENANISAAQVSIVSTHSTATPQGDIQEVAALRKVFVDCPNTLINNSKCYMGHAMGAAGALELAGNLPSFEDNYVHPAINIDDLDPECSHENLLINKPKKVDSVDFILNNSFGMLGINSTLIISRFRS